MQPHALQLLEVLRERARCALEVPISDHRIDIKHVSWWSRTVPLSHGIHSTGYTRTWPGQALLPVESRLEHRMLKALTTCAACVALGTQPFTVHYLANNQARSYTPDILVGYVCPQSKQLECFLVEVKTRVQAERYRFKLEERQRAVLEATAIPLVVMTEDDLDPSLQEVEA